MPATRISSQLRLAGMGAAVGLGYGLMVRMAIHLRLLDTVVPVMSIAFLFLLPLAMGFLAVYVVERKQPQKVWVWILLPWLPVVGASITTLLVLIEGFICVLMFLPVGLVLGTVGGLAGGMTVRMQQERLHRASLGCVLVLPLLVGPWEQKMLTQRDVRTVESTIDIQAPAAVVWNNIERVRKIDASELPHSWTQEIGFPAPIEATLSKEGVGGVRNATFAGGVLFVETIDVWEPYRRLSFSIVPKSVPSPTLDDHVTVGGPFFDVLRGEYDIEPLANGSTRLHLLSRHRLSTDFNFYSHFWTDAVMADIQKSILSVIRARSEKDRQGL